MTRSLLDSSIEIEVLVLEESSYVAHLPVKYEVQQMDFFKLRAKMQRKFKNDGNHFIYVPNVRQRFPY